MQGVIRSFLVLAYAVGAVGALLEISGGYWDVTWHTLQIPETFFTPPHMVLYSGIFLLLVAVLIGMASRIFSKSAIIPGSMVGIIIALLGVTLQLFSGGFDFWWHNTFGFDPVLFSPPHGLLIIGMALNGIGMSLGTTRIYRILKERRGDVRWINPRKWMVLMFVAYTALWLDLNTLVYLFTDLDGIAFTFKLGQAWPGAYRIIFPLAAMYALGITGALMLTGIRRVLPWRGVTTILAGLAATTWTLATGIWLASPPFLLTFALMVLPVFLLEWRDTSRFLTTWIAVVLGPFAFALNGWNFLGFYRFVLSDPVRLAYILPTLAMGLVGLHFGKTIIARFQAVPSPD